MRRPPLLHRMLGLPRPGTAEVTVHADLEVPMRDGVVLHADRIAPDGDRNAPVLLMRSAYGRGQPWRLLYGRTFAAYGYQVVIASCRGSGDTGGRLQPFDEHDDGVDTIRWLRAQPWYSGRLVLVAPSYLGLAQWALVDTVPSEELLAVVAILTSSRLVRSMFDGGALSLQWLAWTAQIADQQTRGPGVTTIVSRTFRRRRLTRAHRHLPLSEADRIVTGRTLAWWREWLAHPDPGDNYWQHRDWSHAVGRLRAPTAMITSWHDHFLPWQLADWADLPADTPRRLVIGPWVHEDPRLLRLYLREAVAWLEAHVRGGARQVGTVRSVTTWAVPSSGVTPRRGHHRMRLRGAGTCTPAAACRWPSRRPRDPARTATIPPTPHQSSVVPARGATHGGASIAWSAATTCCASPVTRSGSRSRSPAQAAPPCTCTPASRTPMWSCACATSMPAAGHTNVCDGIRRVHLGDTSAGVDGVHAVEVDLWPTAHRFDRGHRLRVQVASGAFPRYSRNPGTGEPPATATRLVAADQEVHHTPAHPSHIRLPATPTPATSG